MSATVLKSQIIDKVNSLTDEAVLRKIYRLIDFEAEKDSECILTDEEKSGIKAGLGDVEVGRVYTSIEANHIIREWLKK